MSNQKYTDEFRKAAVKLALESSDSNSIIAGNLGVNYKTFMSWIRNSMKNPDQSNISINYKSRYQELVSENGQLKKDLKQTKLEREILKKAAAYFASQNL